MIIMKYMYNIILTFYKCYFQLMDGYIMYTYTNSITPQTFLFDDVAVNDGQWHDFETRWLENGNLIMLLDFGQRQVCQIFRALHPL